MLKIQNPDLHPCVCHRKIYNLKLGENKESSWINCWFFFLTKGPNHPQNYPQICPSTLSQKGTSLVVEWLRLHTPNEGGLISGQKTRSHMLQLRPVQSNKYLRMIKYIFPKKLLNVMLLIKVTFFAFWFVAVTPIWQWWSHIRIIHNTLLYSIVYNAVFL